MAVASDRALGEAIDGFLLELRVERGLSPLTIAAYRRDLAQFATAADPAWRTAPDSARHFLEGQQRDGRRATTLARKAAAVRSFYGFAQREGVVNRDVATLVEAPRPGSYLPDVLTPGQVIAFLEAIPADDPVGARDLAI